MRTGFVMSACNTAAGASKSAQALSGLAPRPFSMRAPRALLVSHWAVNSQAAVAITTGAFDAQSADPTNRPRRGPAPLDSDPDRPVAAPTHIRRSGRHSYWWVTANSQLSIVVRIKKIISICLVYRI